MRKNLFVALLVFAGAISFAQTKDNCSYGTRCDTTYVGVNISTGGLYEYTAAADFDVPFGTIFTANQLIVNLNKGPADVNYIDVSILTEIEGMPGEVIQSFMGMIPASQELNYTSDLGSVYQVIIDLPLSIELAKGKYFIQLSASPGDEEAVGWEITNEYIQNYGEFDFFKFEDEPWGGTGYYDYVFQVVGTSADSGEVLPDLGVECAQEIKSNNYEAGTTFLNHGNVKNLADDFIVAENTKFNLTGFNLHLMLTGGGIHNCTINIRNSENGAPGVILESFVNEGPAYEIFNGYWPLPGLPYDAVAVEVGFAFSEPVELTQGNYFIEVIPTPNSAEDLLWEANSLAGIGSFSYSSFDGGNSWIMNEGYNQVFSVNGFCDATTATGSVNGSAVFNYYPNPVEDFMVFNSQKVVDNISIVNLTGQLVKVIKLNKTLGQVDMSSLEPGVYMYKVMFQEGNIETFKLIKK